MRADYDLRLTRIRQVLAPPVNKNAGYYQESRDEVARFIPDNCKTLLDVGCGQGQFGAALKRQHENLEIWGVEYVPQIAELAKLNLDRVVVGDIAQQLNQLPDGYFDCITFNDSLEHLVDPFTLLEQIKTKLSPQGTVLSSIPNVRYYSNLRNLLFKKQWRYEDAGILDRTHLRFFTERSIIDMYHDAGYEIELMEGINRTKKRRVKRIIRCTFGWLRDIQFQQFATRARPKLL